MEESEACDERPTGRWCLERRHDFLHPWTTRMRWVRPVFSSLVLDRGDSHLEGVSKTNVANHRE